MSWTCGTQEGLYKVLFKKNLEETFQTESKTKQQQQNTQTTTSHHHQNQVRKAGQKGPQNSGLCSWPDMAVSRSYYDQILGKNFLRSDLFVPSLDWITLLWAPIKSTRTYPPTNYSPKAWPCVEQHMSNNMEGGKNKHSPHNTRLGKPKVCCRRKLGRLSV